MERGEATGLDRGIPMEGADLPTPTEEDERIYENMLQEGVLLQTERDRAQPEGEREWDRMQSEGRSDRRSQSPPGAHVRSRRERQRVFTYADDIMVLLPDGRRRRTPIGQQAAGQQEPDVQDEERLPESPRPAQEAGAEETTEGG